MFLLPKDLVTMNLNPSLKEAFNAIKPVCDLLMVNPSLDNLCIYRTRVMDMTNEVIQGLQQYLMFPLIPRLKCNEIRKKVDIHLKVLENVLMVLDRIDRVNNFEMFVKIETGLLSIVFDSNNPGMISNATEEVKYSTVKCLTTLMLKIPENIREKILRTHVPMIAQAVFVAVHIAKLEKLRALRLEAIQCVLAHAMVHRELTNNYRISNADLELLVVDLLLSSILPGVLAALQDVATDNNNPGHAVVASALEAIHRILCLPMHDKYLVEKPITTEDFVRLVRQKKDIKIKEVSKKVEKCPKKMAKRSEEWFEMAGKKLTLITQCLVGLRTHEHHKVKKELAVFCYRIISECSRTMSASVPMCLNVLVSMSKDTHPELSQYGNFALKHYLESVPEEKKHVTVDIMMENFMDLLKTLPRVLNNIDNNDKLYSLNLLVGYLERLGDEEPLSAAATQQLVTALAAAAEHDVSLVKLTRVANRDVAQPPPAGSPWSALRHVPEAGAAARLHAAARALAASASAHAALDLMLHQYQHDADCGLMYIMNVIVTAEDVHPRIVKRIFDAYVEDEAWCGSIEEREEVVDNGDTLDVTVYNPREWHKDRVPDLYEGTIETRYTDIRLSRAARAGAARRAEPLARRVLRRALAVSGVGGAARVLCPDCHQFLIKTLCPVLENVGSEYEVVHLAGLKAINQIAAACGQPSVADLIRCNADYFTNHITTKLKKAWDCKSALQILSVVMEYSDPTTLDCLYAIQEDVLVQSCDKYYESNLLSYLKVFLTFIECIRRWFPTKEKPPETPNAYKLDLLHEVNEYVRHTHEAERLLSDTEFENSAGKSIIDMYKEDKLRKEEELMDYDDTVAAEKPPLPLHVKVAIGILRRIINFVTSLNRDCALFSLQILEKGLPILLEHEDELLPLVHSCWAPLIAKFKRKDPVTLRRAFDLLVTLARLSKDFIRSRTVKEVLPEIYKFLHNSAKDSYLKDAGSFYRNSAAYTLQLQMMTSLPSLAIDLGLDDAYLEEAMACFDVYLSNKQPKPLQAAAVNFFKDIKEYDYGAVWYHLRKLCDNDLTLEPPELKYLRLEPIIGTPYQPKDKDYEHNVKLIFNIVDN